MKTKLNLYLFLFFIFIFLPRLASADWERTSGQATDIGIGGGQVWVTGIDSVSGGYGIHRLAGKGWQTIQGGAIAISVDSAGNPWVVNASGDIFRYQNGWHKLPGNAVDIAIGGDQTWVIGSDSVPGGHSIFHWNGSGWDRVEGGGKRIAVDSFGNPWIVNSQGEIFRLVRGAWQRLPGLAKDIAVGADGSAWVVGVDSVAGGNSIHRWTGSGWEDIAGGAKRIAVDASGHAWVVNIDGHIFKYHPDSIRQKHHKHRDTNTIRLGGNKIHLDFDL